MVRVTKNKKIRQTVAQWLGSNIFIFVSAVLTRPEKSVTKVENENYSSKCLRTQMQNSASYYLI